MPIDIAAGNSFDHILIGGKRLLNIQVASAGLRSNKSTYTYINGVYVGGSGRSHNILTINTSGTIIRNTTYDVYGYGATYSTPFVNDLTTDDNNGNLIIVSTWDEPRANSTPVWQKLQTIGFQKAWCMSQSFRSAWCGIYIHSRGVVAEEASMAWSSPTSTIVYGDEPRAFCQIQAAVVF